MKNNAQEKMNTIEKKKKTNDKVKDDESTTEDWNIPVVSNDEDDENKSNEAKIYQ